MNKPVIKNKKYLQKTIKTGCLAFLLAITVLTLPSCYRVPGTNGLAGSFTPKPLFLSNLPKGNDSYSEGFRDGCYNFIGQNGFGFMRFHERPANKRKITDPLYIRGYYDGDSYCGVYVNKNIIL